MAVEGCEKENPGMEAKGKGEKKKKHSFFDEPSPRSVFDMTIYSPDSDGSSSTATSSSSGSPNSTEVLSISNNDKAAANQDNNQDNNGLQWKGMFGSIKKKSARRFSVIPLISTYELITRMNLKRKFSKTRKDSGVVIDCDAMLACKPSWRNFDLAELASATDNFSSENLIGEGGHARVYRGCLSDGQVVAVKTLIKTDKEDEDRAADFLSELGIIAHINHQNAAKLLGFGIDTDFHLVLEYLPNGSLATLLHGEENHLDWKKRFKIAVGIAEGLSYLHHECQRRIIHRDIKASNILLDKDYGAQLSDFGLAKWLPENWIHHVVYPIEGTFGYLAPEYFMHGIVDEKTDVFAYGVLLLEIITGREAVDSSKQSLVIWARSLLEENDVTQLCDPRLGDDYDPSEMKLAMCVASMCIHHLPTERPYMNRVVKILKGEETPMEMMKQKSRRTVMLDHTDLPEYTCTSYLNDLDRHMELVME